MVVQTYNVIDFEKGKLDRTIFSDPDIYQEELEKIFGRSWLFIGHESQIRSPNDFVLTYMGEDPVILTRDSKGKVHAFLNMCRHRGNRIVRADDGNAKNFMCAYHGWTYSNEGKLVSVPGLQEAYYGELDVENLGLVSVAHLDTYAGLIFATWAGDAPSLEAYLGDFRWYMDMMFNRRDGGMEFIGPDKWIIPCNWKNPADNFIGDSYHAVLSHRSAAIAQAIRRGRPPQPIRYYTEGSNEVSPGNGHGMSAFVFDTKEDFLKRNQGQQQGDGEVQKYQESIRPEMERRIGPTRTWLTTPGHATCFPNLSWLTNRTVRLWHPRGPLQTEVWSFTSLDADSPDEIKRTMRIQCMQSFGPSGLLEQDDMDNWRNASGAGRSLQARKYPQNISMGVGREVSDPRLPGVSTPNNMAELPQRAMYVRWQEMMNADSWADISVDPITATFEGTATMQG
jgi:phenylpropionate dioxygenase-like ring-hydroxylating dioxygenase large terminal subunit